MQFAIKLFLFALLSYPSFSSHAFAKTVEDANNRYTLKDAEYKPLLVIGGLYSTIFVHETGHLVSAFLTGGEIIHFKPYPHTSNGKSVGGSVRYKGRTFFAPFVSLMGVGAEMAMAYYLAPQIPRASSPELRFFWEISLTKAAFGWPLYLFFEFLGFQGDMHDISTRTGIPRWVLAIPALVSSYFLFKRLENFKNEVPNSKQIESIESKSGSASSTIIMNLPISLSVRSAQVSPSIISTPFLFKGALGLGVGVKF